MASIATKARFRTLDDLGDVRGKRALVRVDLNVPMSGLHVTDDTRFRATLPTVTELSGKGAITLLLSHFGRPNGIIRPDMSLSLVTRPYSQCLGRGVRFIENCEGPAAMKAVQDMAPGDVAILENTRFHPEEERNESGFTAAMAELGDIYVNDAFSAAHRAHASTEGLAHLLPVYAGRSMERELNALEAALGSPARPLAAIVGGAKVSSKLAVLHHLVTKVDHLIIGGGMANTFLSAQGIEIGKSLCEFGLTSDALTVLELAERSGCTIHLPWDVVVAKRLEPGSPSRTTNVREVGPGDLILDIGPASVEAIADVLKNCRTLIWNGPLGAFETSPFDRATVALARIAGALTRSGQLVSVAGGGETVAALNHAGAAQEFTFVSTAGGAFLEWMEGRELPGVAALMAE